MAPISKQIVIKCSILFILPCLTITLGENETASAISHQTRHDFKPLYLDTSVFIERCNDYLDRLIISVEYHQNGSAGFASGPEFALVHRTNIMDQSNLITLIPSHENSTTRTIVDTYFSHQLGIVSVAGNRTICRLDFMRFGHCDVIDIEVNVAESNCSATVHSLRDGFTLVPYIYLVAGLLLVVFISIKFVNMFFNKYRHI